MFLHNMAPLIGKRPSQYVPNKYRVVHRADFHKALMRKAKDLGVHLRLNSFVDKIDFTKPSCTLKSGEQLDADLILGCDGLKSRTRELMLGYQDPPKDTGDIAYRILVPASEMKKHKELSFLLENGSRAPLNYWMGPDCHVVCYLLKGGDLYNIVLLCPDNLPEKVTTAPGDLEEMRAIFANWDPRLRLLLSLVSSCLKWKLQNHDELERWVHETGKVALLGDSCHPTLPYLASGAAMAVEDGAVLGILLAKLSCKADLKHILGIYENMRKSRTTVVVQRSTHYRSIFHCHDGPDQIARDRRLLEDGPFKEGSPNQWADPYLALL